VSARGFKRGPLIDAPEYPRQQSGRAQQAGIGKVDQTDCADDPKERRGGLWAVHFGETLVMAASSPNW